MKPQKRGDKIPDTGNKKNYLWCKNIWIGTSANLPSRA